VVHIEVIIIIGNLVIVLVLLPLEQAFVAIGVVGSPRARAHVVSVTLVCGGPRLQLIFSIGVEAPERQDDDLVVEERAEDE